MHFLKVTGLISLALWADNALANPVCASQSVVFVTVTAPVVTKTVVSLPFKNVATAVETALAVTQTTTLTDITTTLTSRVTFTEFFTVAPAIPAPSRSGEPPASTASHPEATDVAADKGPYYFSEHDGTLAWLDGKTPPATGSFLTVTTFITVQPVPTNFPALAEETTLSIAEESTVATTYSTVSLYSVTTVYRTKVITSTIPIPAIAVKFSPGSAGWNSSFTALLKGGSGNPKPTVWQTGATHVTGQLEARQVGAWVTATINGVVVSWINSYDGKPTSTPPSPNPTVEVPTEGNILSSNEKSEDQPVYPWDLTPLPEPAPLAIYAWDITPPSPRTTASAPNNISSSTQSSKTAARSKFPIRSKSTFSTVTTKSAETANLATRIPVRSRLRFSAVTTKSVTSVFSFTPVQPAPVKGPGLSNTSNNPSLCDGEVGGKAEFVLTFDDLPTFSAGPNTTDIPPIFNPYRKLYFEEHFGYVPPPSVPFLPHSPPQLAVYRVGDGLNVNGSPGAGLELVGEIGSGPRALYSAFWIDAFSFWIGCENKGPSDCKVTINGYELASVIRTAYQDVTIPPCGESRGCKLTYVELREDFRNLTGVQILAAVDRQLTDFYLDDVSLAWSNNTCAAQQQRATIR